jgi:hypothetical protein
MALESEIATYQRCLPELLVADEGRYVVIHGDEVAGTWQTYQDALQSGYAKYGLDPFLVKQILIAEQVHWLPRGIVPLP